MCIAFGQQQANEETHLRNSRLRNSHMTKKATENSFRQNLHVLPAGSGSFLSSSVLFFEQNMLDAEQRIKNYKFCRA